MDRARRTREESRRQSTTSTLAHYCVLCMLETVASDRPFVAGFGAGQLRTDSGFGDGEWVSDRKSVV